MNMTCLRHSPPSHALAYVRVYLGRGWEWHAHVGGSCAIPNAASDVCIGLPRQCPMWS